MYQGIFMLCLPLREIVYWKKELHITDVLYMYIYIVKIDIVKKIMYIARKIVA